jgi:hypothetical protein
VEFVEKIIFQNFFRGKLQFFPTFWGEKFSAENSTELSLEKMYEKSADEFVKNRPKYSQTHFLSKLIQNQ